MLEKIKSIKKIYAGNGDPLYLRLSDYYQTWYLKSRDSLYIIRSMNKYTMTNFNLHILEYTDSKNLISCEQKWIDYLLPKYNINPVAGSSKGYKHNQENTAKMRNIALGRKHTQEVKNAMSKNRSGVNAPFYGKIHSLDTIEKLRTIAQNRDYLPVPGLEVEITDLETKITSVYNSVRSAAKSIDSDIKTLLRREKSQLEKGVNTPYRNRFIIIIKRDK